MAGVLRAVGMVDEARGRERKGKERVGGEVRREATARLIFGFAARMAMANG
jgi:hypothetical protein